MSNLIDKQKFKSSLMAQGITMSDDEIDSYLERVSVNEKHTRNLKKIRSGKESRKKLFHRTPSE